MILVPADTTLVTLGRLLDGMTRRYQTVEAEDAPGTRDRQDSQAEGERQIVAG
jgi:hypothetical protein